MVLLIVRVFLWVVIAIGISLSNTPAISVIEALLVMRVSMHVLLTLSRSIVELVVVIVEGVVMIGVSLVVMFTEIFVIKVKSILFQDTHWSKRFVIEAVLLILLAAGVFPVMIKVHSRDSIFFGLRVILL
jgi:hypothetical protein